MNTKPITDSFGKSFVYLLADEDNEFMKIGTTTKLFSRIKDIQTGNPRELRIIGLMKGGKKEEEELHERFNRYRKRGEWFYYNDEILNTFNPKHWKFALSPRDLIVYYEDNTIYVHRKYECYEEKFKKWDPTKETYWIR